MESPEELTEKLRELCESGTRGKLLARGLARGMIWDDGVLPEGSPNFSPSLTNDLLNHGYLVLGCAIRLRSLSLREDIPDTDVLDSSFLTAAECIEAVVRYGERRNDRGFHLTIAAAAFHLAHYGARSFSLLAENTQLLNLVHNEQILVALMQRRLDELERLLIDWLNDENFTDAGISASLESDDDQVTVENAAYLAITRVFNQAIATFEFAVRTGENQFAANAIEMLDKCVNAADRLTHVPLWWICVLARHLIDDLWGRSLHQILPLAPNDDDNWNRLRADFIELLGRRSISEIDLWPSQTLAAKRVIDESDSLVVALPTSSGKTRIAELCILKCLAGKRRVIYVTPLRALSAQVEGTLGRCFKPLGFTVTSVYGASGIGASDVDTMRSADIVVATPEKLDFAIRQDPDAIADVGLIVLDEGHMIGLSEREIRYEILVQRLLRRADADKRRIVCLSAIFTEGAAFDAFTQWIRSDNDGNAIQSNWRPTRQIPATLRWTDSRGWLEYRVAGEKVFIPRFIEEASPKRPRRNPFPQNQAELVVAAIERFSDDGHSVLLYCPLRSSVETAAETFLKMESYGYAKSHLRTEAAIEIKRALSIGEEWLGISHVAIRALRLGIAVHHGQLPRPFLSELEDLLKRQVLSVAISSPTLAQGVDLSFGVLIFKSLWRSGELIKAKEFANVIGRVGRAFVDIDGIYVLPVLELAPGREANRLDEFHRLIRHAKSRELESGLYLLISICLSRLKRKLDLEDNALSDYVLNQQQAIDTMAEGSDENAEQMEIILAELDAGILALVDNLECDDSQIASKLDEALNNSLWKRRLAIKELEERRNQIAMLHGRALHIWKRTNVAQRKGFYSASIGTESGLQIVANRSELESLLESATKAIRTGAVEQLSDDCCKLAKTLFQFYPFQPSMPADWDESTWTAILDAWIKGAALHRVTNSAGIAFVQEAIIYRLVWAIESVRLVLNNLAENTKDGLVINDDRTFVAICLTYGVPKMSAARMLECGMESRLLAVRIAKELNLNFTKRDELIDWLIQYKETEPLTFSEEERTAWQRFVDRNEYSFDLWLHRNDVYEVRLGSGIEVELGKSIRIIPNENGSAELYTPDFEWLGRTKSNVTAERSLIGTTIEQGRVIAKTFGPPKRSKGTSASHNK